MIIIEYQINGEELRRRINNLAAYLYVDSFRLPVSVLKVVAIDGLIVPDGPIKVRAIFDPAEMAGGDDEY